MKKEIELLLFLDDEIAKRTEIVLQLFSGMTGYSLSWPKLQKFGYV